MMMSSQMADAIRRVFSGDSEMAGILRGLDWNRTPLGPPDTWPLTLCNTVGIVLASPTPMCVIWGNEAALIYNDAWAKLLDLKDHASVLARSGRDVWKSLWDQINGAIDQVKAAQETTLLEDVAYGDQHLSLSLVPAWGERDRIDGILVAADATDLPIEARAKDDFLSLFGHELRNPLSALSTTLQVLRRQAPSAEVALMDRSLAHLTRLVDDLLDLSHLKRGKLELRTTTLELAHVIDLSLEKLARPLEERRTQIFVRAPRVGLGIECDPERMAQAIANVVQNASQYSEPGSKVVIEAQNLDGRIRMQIKDEGAGIEASRLANLYVPFRETQGRAEHAGLGLGLAIARHLVELQGGDIRVDSAGIGKGTIVTIELPHQPAPAVEVTAPATKKARKRVLLVEDNHDAATALQKALEMLGYQVALAHNGPVALTVAKAFQPDVALLDINLPVLDGWELSKRLRELRVPARELHFVAVTARDQEQDRQKSAEAGFVEHLVKPIDLGKLERVVENLPDPSPGR
jgi:signal transduction histidine kinase/ActR/RegA family two-component response regulator